MSWRVRRACSSTPITRCRRTTARSSGAALKLVAMSTDTLQQIKEAIRTIPDYPKPGIMFRDITTLLGNAQVYRKTVELLVEPWRQEKVDRVAGIEARGFILGGVVAHELTAGFVPIRKRGKLPHTTVRVAYS